MRHLTRTLATIAALVFVAGTVAGPISPAVAAPALPAFPGAEGFGALTVGGRGGRIIAVTNTNESGPGSLAAAIEATGPRIVVFRTGGYITLHQKLVIKNPYLTIAGQTAPGDGIVIRGGPLYVGTHDVIIRGLRIRPGDALDGERSTIRDAIAVSSSYTSQDVYNVIIDHNSFSWGVDETASSWTDRIRDITYSWNIISESLHDSIHIDEGQTGYAPHSMGFLVGDYSEAISVHHNLLAHNKWRNAFIRQGSTEFINNVIYNWGQEPTSIQDSNSGDPVNLVNIIGNYYKAGPNTSSARLYGVVVNSTVTSGSGIYLKGNVGPGRPTDTGDEWTIAFCNPNCYKSTSPAFPLSGVTSLAPSEAYAAVLNNAGALMPKRDAVDTYVVDTVRTGTGKIIDCIQTCDEATDIRNYHNGWPAYTAGSPPADADADGMPDAWEQSRGGDLNPSTAAPSGYTWVEEYINSLIPSVPGASPTSTRTPTPGSPSPTPTLSASGDLLANLSVYDAASAADWSVQTNCQVGDLHYGDRTYAYTAVPAVVTGQTWIRSAADSKTYTESPLVSFTLLQSATVYVAHDDRILTKPAWMSGWTNTGVQTVDDASPHIADTLFAKHYGPGSSISLGPNSDTHPPSSSPTYTIFIVPDSATPSRTPTAPGPTATATPVFADVPSNHAYYHEIEALYRASYISGCSTNPLLFCPDATMNRAESSVFVERGIHSASYVPPPSPSQVFADVPLESWAASWVHAIWQDQFTQGCGTNPLTYCPWQGHTRAEGAVFYLRMLNGAGYTPPPPTQQLFADVPLDAWYSGWMHAAFAAGILPACQTSPDVRLCPEGPLTRGLAAYMMVRAKGLPTGP